jgi:hypothetical protein
MGFCPPYFNSTTIYLRHATNASKGGATVLKVGGTISRAERAKKIF